MQMTLLVRSACRMKARARWNSPDRARCVRSPEMATTSKRRSAISASIASYCAGTAGWPKCRSEQWKTLTVVTPASQPRDDGVGELVGRSRAAQVARHHLLLANRRLEGVADLPRTLAVGHVLQHHARGEDQRARIRDPLARDVGCRAVNRLEDRPAEPDVGTRREPEPTDEPRDE